MTTIAQAHATIDAALELYPDAAHELLPVAPGLPTHLSGHEEMRRGYVAAFYPDMDSMYSSWGETRAEALINLAENIDEVLDVELTD